MKTFLLNNASSNQTKKILSTLGLLTLVITIPIVSLAVLNTQQMQTYQKSAAPGDNFLVNNSFETTETVGVSFDQEFAAEWGRGGGNWIDNYAWILKKDMEGVAPPDGNNILYLASNTNIENNPDAIIRYEQLLNLTEGEYNLSAKAKPLLLNGRGILVTLRCADSTGCGSVPYGGFTQELKFTEINGSEPNGWSAKQVEFNIPNSIPAANYFVTAIALDGSESYFDQISLKKIGTAGTGLTGLPISDPNNCRSRDYESCTIVNTDPCTWYACVNMCLPRGTDTDLVCNATNDIELVKNGSFEQTGSRTITADHKFATSWEDRGTAATLKDRLSWINENGEKLTGNNSLYIASRVVDTTGWNRYGQVIDLQAGTYTLSANAKTIIKNGRGVVAALACMDAAGCGPDYQITNWISSISFNSMNQWEQKEVSVDVPTNGRYVVWLFANDGSEAYFDDIVLTGGEESTSNSVNLSGQVYCTDITTGNKLPVGGIVLEHIKDINSDDKQEETLLATSAADGSWSASKSVSDWSVPIASIRPDENADYPYASRTDTFTGVENGIDCEDSNLEGISFNGDKTAVIETHGCTRQSIPIDSVNFNVGYCIENDSLAESKIYIKASMQAKPEGKWNAPFNYWIDAVDSPNNFIAEMVQGQFNIAGETEIDVDAQGYNLQEGKDYYFHIKPYQHLSKTTAQAFQPGMTIDFGEMLAGDVYLPNEQGVQDGEVNAADFSKIVAEYYGNKDYYDLNADGEINGADLSLIIANWYKSDQ